MFRTKRTRHTNVTAKRQKPTPSPRRNSTGSPQSISSLSPSTTPSRQQHNGKVTTPVTHNQNKRQRQPTTLVQKKNNNNNGNIISLPKRFFRIGGTLGLGNGPIPPQKPSSISSRFRRAQNEQGNENGEDDGYAPTFYSEDESGPESSESYEDSTNLKPMVISVDGGEDQVLSPKKIADAVQSAMHKLTGNQNISIDPTKIQVMTIEEARKMFNNPQDSDFEGVDLSTLSDDGTMDSNSKKNKTYKRLGSTPFSISPINAATLPITATSTSSATTTTAFDKVNTSSQPEMEVMSLLDQSRQRLSQLSAPEIVAYLDSHVIAQEEAKKALAIAVRNRERRFRLQTLHKPSAISDIEEVGIRLAQKYGYTLRQELFSQIGRPTLYDSQHDPALSSNDSLSTTNTTTTAYTTDTSTTDATTTTGTTTTITPPTTTETTIPKGKKGKKDAKVPTTATLAQQQIAAATNQTNTVNTTAVKDYLLDRPSHLSLQDTAAQNAKLLLNNQVYGRQLASEVNPFNILMVGPTGSGKTELVKRLCTLLEAPYVHADATRYTETGVVGTDVDQILVDLYKDAIEREKKMEMIKVKPHATKRAIAAIVNAIRGSEALAAFLEQKGLNLIENMGDTSPPAPFIRTTELNKPVVPSEASIITDDDTTNASKNDKTKGKKGGKKSTSTPTTPETNTKSTTTTKSKSAKAALETVAKSVEAIKKNAKKDTTKDTTKKVAAKKDTTKVDAKTPTKATTTKNTKTVTKTATQAPVAPTTKGKKATTTSASAAADVSVKKANDPKGKVNTKKNTSKDDAKNKKPVKVKGQTIDEGIQLDHDDDDTGYDADPELVPTTTIANTKNEKASEKKAKSPSKTKNGKKGGDALEDDDAAKLLADDEVKARGERQYPQVPPFDSKKLQTTPFDDDDKDLFSTDVDDESSYYNKKVKPLMFQNLSRKYLEQPTITTTPAISTTTTADGNDATKVQPRTFIPTFDDIKQWVKAGHLDDFVADIPLPVPTPPKLGNDQASQVISLEELVSPNQKPKTKMKNRRVTVSYALEQLVEFHCNDMVKEEELHERALKNCERNGVVFIDEIDKLVSAGHTHTTTSASKGEAVQRELLSLLQGKVVKRNGLTINTENILFICAGAFHHAAPSQLLPELQGRLPVITKLNPLTQIQLALVLTIPVYSVLKQYMTLMKADGIDIKMDDEAIWEMSKAAADLNERTLNLGARRLHNIINSVFGYISFNYANGLRLQVDPLGRLTTITSNEQEMELSLHPHAKPVDNTRAPTHANGQRLQNSKQPTNSLNLSVPLDPKDVDILPNGETSITITKEYVQKTLKHMMDRVDVSRFLL